MQLTYSVSVKLIQEMLLIVLVQKFSWLAKHAVLQWIWRKEPDAQICDLMVRYSALVLATSRSTARILPPGRGAILTCLKEKQRDNNIALNVICQKMLTKDIRKGSKDANALPGIHENCKEDLKKFCAKVTPGAGRTHKCLRDNMQKLSRPCKQAEFEQELNEAKDINTKTNLSKACQADLLNICKIDVVKLEKENKQDDGKAPELLEGQLAKALRGMQGGRVQGNQGRKERC